jgi:hypothetical protein
VLRQLVRRIGRKVSPDTAPPPFLSGSDRNPYKVDLERATAFSDPYNRNLASPDVPWGTVLSYLRVPFVPGEGIVSSGPFRIDFNHRETALLVGPLYVLLNGRASDSPNVQPHLGRTNLCDTTVRLNIALRDGLPDGRLVYWFQSIIPRTAVAGGPFEMPPRFVNYFHNTDLTKSAIAGETIEIPLHADLNEWTALGRNPCDMRPMIGSAAKYTACVNRDEFAGALSAPGNTGFLYLLPTCRNDSPINWLPSPLPFPAPEIMHGTKLVLREFTILA